MVLLLLAAGITLSGQNIAVLRPFPFASPENLAALESRVLEAPEDLDARTTLLRLYVSMAPPAGHDDPARRSLGLQQILYLIEHHPEAAVSGSKAMYVYRANGPYANAADHDAVRDEWLAAVQGHPKDNAVTLNAVNFLLIEDPDDAEQVLQRAVEADPGNREIAANLGFLYAGEILSPDRVAHATEELQQSSNAVVLAAAGTALPNLAMRATAGRVVDPKVFGLANQLALRARQLAPDDRDIQGPMPLIRYFAEGQSPASAPGRIRVSEGVQAANLIRKTQPQPPADANITGEVRFVAIIGRDGTIQNLQLVSGHPLLVDAARQAAKTWLYKPTMLNGAPVEVVTTITIQFPPN